MSSSNGKTAETARMPGGGVLVRPADVGEDEWSHMVAVARAERMNALKAVQDKMHPAAYRDHMQACFGVPLAGGKR